MIGEKRGDVVDLALDGDPAAPRSVVLRQLLEGDAAGHARDAWDELMKCVSCRGGSFVDTAMPWFRQSNCAGWQYNPSSAELKAFLPSEERLTELARQHPNTTRSHIRQTEATRLWRIARHEGRVQYAEPRPDGDRPLQPSAPRKRRRSEITPPPSPPQENIEEPPQQTVNSPLLQPVSAAEQPAASPAVQSTPTPEPIAPADLLILPPLNADINFPELLDRRVRIREAAHFESWVWGTPEAFLSAVPFIAGMLAMMEEEDKIKRTLNNVHAARADERRRGEHVSSE